MALRTAEQYLSSLRDGRVVYYAGKRVEDVTTHPDFGLKARSNATIYRRGEDEPAEFLALHSVRLEDGERIRRWFQAPRDREDLLRQIEMAEQSEETQNAISAGINALKIVARKADAAAGAQVYSPRIEQYADWFARNDLFGALAMTDAKGDRSKPPHQQADPDLWVRVVERRRDGVVIRGAKTSVTNGGLANELLVLPTHAMSEADRDWSLACAVPVDAPGVVQLTNYVGHPWGEQFKFDRPLTWNRVSAETTVVFNDVFVPWERVFMDGESQYTREFLGYFTTYHRSVAIVKEPTGTRKLIGAAQLMARYNGLEHVGGIRNQISDMIMTAQLLEVLRYTALSRVSYVDGVCVPDAVACNLSGLTGTETRGRYLSFLCELAGGPVLTAPSGLDLANPETADLVRKYYVGKEGVSADDRLALVKWIYDIAASDSAAFAAASSVTAAGSPSARRVAVGRGFDVEACIGLVREELQVSAAEVRVPAQIG